MPLWVGYEYGDVCVIVCMFAVCACVYMGMQVLQAPAPLEGAHVHMSEHVQMDLFKCKTICKKKCNCECRQMPQFDYVMSWK